jgi:Icc-related predicted phosphoesterase
MMENAMRLLLFSDLHCDTDAAQRLVRKADDYDVIVGAGDFATMRQGLAKTIGVLQAIERPVVLVPGNSESREELVEACTDWPTSHVLHGSGVTVDGTEFYGLGGGIPVTPFGSWSYDFTEEQAAELLYDCPRGCVLVVHSPPLDAVDQGDDGRHFGSTAIRRAIERKQPRLVVCGHIHSSWEQQAHIGGTPVVNAGPHGIRWDLATNED